MSAKASMAELNVFGSEAMIAAYNEGEAWLDALLLYLKENFNYLQSFIETEIPAVKVFPLEGTYLAWLDFRGLELGVQELDHLLVHEARVGLNEGHLFGREGEGFQRMNIACPRSLLAEGLTRLRDAIVRPSE